MVLWFTITAPLTPLSPCQLYRGGDRGRRSDADRLCAVRLAWALYIVPILMAYTPILMDKDASWSPSGRCGDQLHGLLLLRHRFEGSSAASSWSRTAALRGCRGTSVLHNPPTFIAGVGLMAVGIAIQYRYTPAKEVSPERAGTLEEALKREIDPNRSNRDRGRPHGLRPPTPPGIRSVHGGSSCLT